MKNLTDFEKFMIFENKISGQICNMVKEFIDFVRFNHRRSTLVNEFLETHLIEF